MNINRPTNPAAYFESFQKTEQNETFSPSVLTESELEQVVVAKKDAVVGSLDTIIAEREKRIGPVNSITKMFLSEIPAGVYDGRFIFINTDTLSQTEIPYALHHEAVELVFYHDRERAQDIISQLNLGEVTQMDTWNKDRPEHFVALYEEIIKGKNDNTAETYTQALFQRRLNEIDELIEEFKDRATNSVKAVLIDLIIRLKILDVVGVPFPPSTEKVRQLVSHYF